MSTLCIIICYKYHLYMSYLLHFHNLFFSLMFILLFVLSDISLILCLSHLLFAHLTLCIVWHMSICCWSHLVLVYLMLVCLMLVCLMFVASDLCLILRQCVLYVTHLTKISYYVCVSDSHLCTANSSRANCTAHCFCGEQQYLHDFRSKSSGSR